MLSPQGVQVLSLFGELRSYLPCKMAKKKKKKEFIDKLLESISELNNQNEAGNVLFVDLDADHIS